ncbi:MAG: nucleotidyltransferase domain-containing protein [Planctomycetaceae bacterium]|jgi:lincosamide nucleotidyltransferase|nr:nucleotidyltransferase domain-containing protein [Planctomycetaceae bacterium]
MDQLKIIEKVKAIAQSDANVSAVLMYGSFIRDEGDEYSDVEFYVYLNDKTGFNSRRWVEQIRPIAMFFTNEHGTEVVIFDNMIRGEFHFETVNDMQTIKTWQGFISFEKADKMNLLDKDGYLAAILNSIEIVKPDWHAPENIRWIAESFLNAFLWTRNLIYRGENAHAVMAFGFVQKHFLSLVRLACNATEHWESPTKNLEDEISGEWYHKYQCAIPSLDNDDLCLAYNMTLENARELFYLLNVPEDLKTLLNTNFAKPRKSKK